MLGIFHDSADVFVLKVCLFSFFFHSDVFSLPFFLNNLDLFLFSTVQKKKKKNEQDIEKLAPKRGVVLQAVKEVLQGLVDEDLVHCEKIGISNFFWYFFFFFLLFSVWSRGRRGDKEREKGRGKNSTLSFLISLSLPLSLPSDPTTKNRSFPSEASAKLSSDVARLEAQLAAKGTEAAAAKAALESAAAAAAGEGGAASAERAAALQLMSTKEARVAELRAMLAQYAASDPSRLAAVAEAADLAKDAANRWLDNCFSLRSWMEARFEGRGEEVRAFFEQSGLKEDAEYL